MDNTLGLRRSGPALQKRRSVLPKPEWSRRVSTLRGTIVKTSKALAEELFSLFSAGNVAGVMDRMAEDVTWRVAGKLPGSLRGTSQGKNASHNQWVLRRSFHCEQRHSRTPVDMVAQ